MSEVVVLDRRNCYDIWQNQESDRDLPAFFFSSHTHDKSHRNKIHEDEMT